MNSTIGTERNNRERVVLDSSAVLAWFKREPGYQVVETSLPAFVSAVNLAEVVYIAMRRGAQVEELRPRIAELQLTIVDFDEEQAYRAGVLHNQTRSLGLSLADCICLNLAEMRRLPALTADRRWAETSLSIEIQLIR